VLYAFQPGQRPRRRRAPRSATTGIGAGTARIYWCVACRTLVTSEAERLEVAGAHEHSFVNPAGLRFVIGCFGAAAGCRVDGEPTLEHTWFAGHTWSYASCKNCQAHLGWYFAADRARFFGLILSRLLGPV
jgi:hypothetical protein